MTSAAPRCAPTSHVPSLLLRWTGGCSDAIASIADCLAAVPPGHVGGKFCSGSPLTTLVAPLSTGLKYLNIRLERNAEPLCGGLQCAKSATHGDHATVAPATAS